MDRRSNFVESKSSVDYEKSGWSGGIPFGNSIIEELLACERLFVFEEILASLEIFYFLPVFFKSDAGFPVAGRY